MSSNKIKEFLSSRADRGAEGLWARHCNRKSFVAEVACTSNRPTTRYDNLITNPEDFACKICHRFIAKRRGVVIKDCLHHFCRFCLLAHIDNSSNTYVKVKCPKRFCKSMIEDDVIKELLGNDFHKYERKIDQLMQKRYKKNYDFRSERFYSEENKEIQAFKDKRPLQKVEAKDQDSSDEEPTIQTKSGDNILSQQFTEGHSRKMERTQHSKSEKPVKMKKTVKFVYGRDRSSSPLRSEDDERKYEENLSSQAATSMQASRWNENDDQDYIETMKVFKCPICMSDIEIGDGLTLKNCHHEFCKECLVSLVKHSEDFDVKCPSFDPFCTKLLTELEIRKLVPKDILDERLEKSLKHYQGTHAQVISHCQIPNCRGFVEHVPTLRFFWCPVCGVTNCLRCKAIHKGMKCHEYQHKVKHDRKLLNDDFKSKQSIRKLIADKAIMQCPKCDTYLERVEGCDFIICSCCKLRLCWVTKKPRHPLTLPNGKFIDGCHCKKNKIRCHPDCRNCH